jgi:hypothetical protein
MLPESLRPVPLALALLAAPLASAADPQAVRIDIRSPHPGETLRNKTDMAPLAGIAIAGERPTTFDIVVVIDVSGSAAYPSGIDVDNDGVIGETRRSPIGSEPDVPNTDPDDSILAAEVSAARTLLDGLDPTRVHVGVVSFSGEIDQTTGRRLGRSDDALLEQAVTPDYGAVRPALEAVLLRGANGGTNMEAGVKLALRELAGLPGAQSTPRPGA